VNHVHTPNDGLGPRRVFVNGNEVSRVTYANTESGVVRFHPYPYRINHRKCEVYERTLRGTVRVEPISE
jgi:hypothetical protein